MPQIRGTAGLKARSGCSLRRKRRPARRTKSAGEDTRASIRPVLSSTVQWSAGVLTGEATASSRRLSKWSPRYRACALCSRNGAKTSDW